MLINKIVKILCEIRPDVDFDKEKQLLTDEVLDSFDMITLLARLNEEFQIEIPVSEITEENFNSAEAICGFVANKPAGKMS